jgi:hypothetical protein
MLSDWVSFLAEPNLFGIKGFVIVVLFSIYIGCKTEPIVFYGAIVHS